MASWQLIVAICCWLFLSVDINRSLSLFTIFSNFTEILTVLEGTLYVGFVTSNPENRLIAKVLKKGDVFVFPIGLIHFQFNVGHGPAVAIAGLSSQNPGAITIADAVFGADPRINPDFLAKAFQLEKKVVKKLQAQFWESN